LPYPTHHHDDEALREHLELRTHSVVDIDAAQRRWYGQAQELAGADISLTRCHAPHRHRDAAHSQCIAAFPWAANVA
jgi:hypothetical protein